MQFSPATIARGKQLRGVAFATFIVTILARSVLEQTGADTALLSGLQVVSSIGVIGGIATGVFEGISVRAVGLSLLIALSLSGVQYKVIEATVGLPIALTAFSIGLFFFIRRTGVHPAVALAWVLGSLGMLLLAGVAFSAGQPLLSVVAVVAFSVSVIYGIFRSVNAAGRQE